jgi:protein-S-isoprenylcysteine O-methyltransferase Ste14
MDTKLAVRYAIYQVASLAGMAVALFWSAGRVDWWPAWGALAVMAGWQAAEAIIIFRHNPELLADRISRRKGAKGWDAAIVSTLGLVQLIRYILAGLDQRYGRAWGVSVPVQSLAFILCALGYALFVWATATNAFFTRIVRLQPERRQTVVTGGPYRYVRHPAYLGATVYELAVSVLLTSWRALAVSTLTALLLIVRTALEDRTLQAELAGYADYARQVRFRLLPGIW